MAVNIFFNLPTEYGVSGVLGKRYDAIKDYLEWHGLSVEYWVPIFNMMSLVWSEAINAK